MPKKFQGEVVSNKMEKTAVVKVSRIWQHPRYKKRIKRSKKYFAENTIGAETGDIVFIEFCRPLSKKKRWRVVKILDKKTNTS